MVLQIEPIEEKKRSGQFIASVHQIPGVSRRVTFRGYEEAQIIRVPVLSETCAGQNSTGPSSEHVAGGSPEKILLPYPPRPTGRAARQ